MSDKSNLPLNQFLPICRSFHYIKKSPRYNGKEKFNYTFSSKVCGLSVVVIGRFSCHIVFYKFIYIINTPIALKLLSGRTAIYLLNKISHINNINVFSFAEFFHNVIVRYHNCSQFFCDNIYVILAVNFFNTVVVKNSFGKGSYAV